MFKRLVMTGLLALAATMAALGWAEEVAAQADVVVQAAATVTINNKGDNTWLMVAAAPVILMSVPGLALLRRPGARQNMLSVLMQVFTLFCLITVLWVVYGYPWPSPRAAPSAAPSTRCC